jgi:hypothetical protein
MTLSPMKHHDQANYAYSRSKGSFIVLERGQFSLEIRALHECGMESKVCLRCRSKQDWSKWNRTIFQIGISDSRECSKSWSKVQIAQSLRFFQVPAGSSMERWNGPRDFAFILWPTFLICNPFLTHGLANHMHNSISIREKGTSGLKLASFSGQLHSGPEKRLPQGRWSPCADEIFVC